MQEYTLSVRELQADDLEHIARYWVSAGDDYLRGMGADPEKMPGFGEWVERLAVQLDQPYNQKQSYCLIWQVDGRPAGHSNVSKIVFGEEAYMHLHLWESGFRQKGAGTTLVRMTLPYFFENLHLKPLYCEPYALNPAPNKTLEKAGFRFVREYVTTPGFLNFEQPVSRWELSRADFAQLAPVTS